MRFACKMSKYVVNFSKNSHLTGQNLLSIGVGQHWNPYVPFNVSIPNPLNQYKIVLAAPLNTSTSHKVSGVLSSKRTTRYLPAAPHWNACVSPWPTGLSWQAHTFMLLTVGTTTSGLTSVVPSRIVESLPPTNMWLHVTTNVTTCDNMWQHVTTCDNKSHK